MRTNRVPEEPKNDYTRHIRFEKKQCVTNPQTGDIKNVTIIDAYVNKSSIQLYGFGTYEEMMLTGTTVEQVISEMKKQGFSIICDEKKKSIANRIAEAKQKVSQQESGKPNLPIQKKEL